MIVNDEPTYHCLDCYDEPNGWRVYWCQGDGEYRKSPQDKPAVEKHATTRDCERNKAHYPHTYTERCGCFYTNPIRAAARERRKQAAQERAAQAEKNTHSRGGGA